MENSNITFTDEEKRFVLAEIIKTSRLDVNTLAQFIASCGAQPHSEQWKWMQVPQGRTPSQCNSVALNLLAPPSLKRKWSHTQTSEAGPDKRLASMDPRNSSTMAAQHSNTPAGPAGHVPILPRPAMNGARMSPRPSPPPPTTAPKKRGRPSRADRAKDLRPQLPQHLAPRPSESGGDTSDRRPILPAPNTSHENTPYSPIHSHRNSAGSSSSSRSLLQSTDVGRSRVLSDGALDHIHSAPLYLKGSELPHFDSEVENVSGSRSHQRELTTTLAPILQLEPRSNASVVTPPQAVRRETMRNSA